MEYTAVSARQLDRKEKLELNIKMFGISFGEEAMA